MSDINENIISVLGVGKLSVPPDLITVSVDLISEDPDYQLMMAEADRISEKLYEAVTSCGFIRDDIKTSGISIDCRYEYVRNDDRQTRVFRGYVYRQKMNLSFPVDMNKLSELIYAVSSYSASPELSIQFTIADPAAVSEKLLRLTAEDAKKKAEVLADSCGLSLGKLIKVTYGSENASPRNMMLSARSSHIQDVTPENLVLEDSALFVWKLKSAAEKQR